jgi:hypothetical protein
LATFILELLEPTDPESPIAKFLEKNPNGGIHHIAFGTDDISAQLQQASSAGVKLIHEEPFDGAAGKLVAFLHPKSTFGVLTEFCMPQPGSPLIINNASVPFMALPKSLLQDLHNRRAAARAGGGEDKLEARAKRASWLPGIALKR